MPARQSAATLRNTSLASGSPMVTRTPSPANGRTTMLAAVHAAANASARSRNGSQTKFAWVGGTSGNSLPSAEATRSRHDNLGLFKSDYTQPFGAFSGTLPGGLELADGRGVMERHSALW